MKITICGSMSFAKKMYEAFQILTAKGYEVFLPKSVAEFAKGELNWVPGTLSRGEGAERKKSTI